MNTSDQVISPGEPNHLGWVQLFATAGEAHLGEIPASKSKSLATFIHTSDWHICDAESPARQEYLDRYFDPDSEYLSQNLTKLRPDQKLD